jgi:hypothetical protein
VLRVTDSVTLTGLRTTDRTSSGARASGNVVLSKDGVQFVIQSGPWDGSPAALLRQITKATTTTSHDESLHFSADTRSFETQAGDPGVMEASPRSAPPG